MMDLEERIRHLNQVHDTAFYTESLSQCGRYSAPASRRKIRETPLVLYNAHGVPLSDYFRIAYAQHLLKPLC